MRLNSEVREDQGEVIFLWGRGLSGEEGRNDQDEDEGGGEVDVPDELNEGEVESLDEQDEEAPQPQSLDEEAGGVGGPDDSDEVMIQDQSSDEEEAGAGGDHEDLDPPPPQVTY